MEERPQEQQEDNNVIHLTEIVAEDVLEMLDSGQSRQEVAAAIANPALGQTIDEALAFIDEARKWRKRERRGQGLWSILVGIFLVVAGVVVTFLVSWLLSQWTGSIGLVFWGVMLVGLITALAGVWKVLRNL